MQANTNKTMVSKAIDVFDNTWNFQNFPLTKKDTNFSLQLTPKTYNKQSYTKGD